MLEVIERKMYDGRWPEEARRKILAVFVWQQQAEEPQGHANERKAFQQWRGGGVSFDEVGPERGGFSRIPDLKSGEGWGGEGDQQGRGASGVREVNLAGIPQQQTTH